MTAASNVPLPIPREIDALAALHRQSGHAAHLIAIGDAAVTPDDFVLATGETRSVREFVKLAFAEVGRSAARASMKPVSTGKPQTPKSRSAAAASQKAGKAWARQLCALFTKTSNL
jgi:hypothetical protein